MTAKGYTFNKRSGRFKAQARCNGKTVHIGYFDTAEEASVAYLAFKENQA
ncbi:hypothetical protein EOPP23_16940 [Endozoicomonas sp. OPT23]|nr:AP2 domain-containing protein [Endozoicomonas sp. OPT23]MRI34672.1 hypothetical protein [Endozoicomonas sp. OPT23]